MGRIKVTTHKSEVFSFAEFGTYIADTIFDGKVSKVTPSGLTLKYDGITNFLTGSGINITGHRGSGKIDTWKAVDGGKTVAKLTNINWKIADIDKAVDREEAGDAGAMERFLMSQSWDYTDTSADDISPAGSRIGDGIKFNMRGNDRFDLRGGDDKFFSGDGNDVLKGGTGNDILDGGKDADKVIGGNGRDKVLGGSGADVLKGGSGSDVLNGGGGRDRVDGGAGNDSLAGKAGADVFVFKTGYGKDRILDMSGSDRVDLSRHDAVSNFKKLMKTATDTGFGLEFVLGSDILILKGFDAGDVSNGDFIF